MMTARTFAALALLITAGTVCRAEFAFITVEKDPDWTTDGRSYTFHMADGSLAPCGLRVQRLTSHGLSVLAPPTTNNVTAIVGEDLYGIHTPLDVQEFDCAGAAMGDDASGQGYPAGAGCIAATIYDADPGSYGWLRAFSSATISGAAFYADTEARLLDEFGAFIDTWDVTNFSIASVNPAYIIPEFELATVTSTHYVQTALAISGHVATVAALDNNRLQDATVTVMWWCVAITNYKTHAAVTNSGVLAVFGGGTWTGQIDLIRYQPFDHVGTTNTLFLRAVGASARMEFPRSPDIMVHNIVTVPEPALLCGAVLALGALRLRRSGRILPR
jgi:hypothetical protein